MAYYYKHPDLMLPEDDSIIWRYMDVWKFEWMLQTNSIFFSRADKQNDKLEGKFPVEMLAVLERVFGSTPSDDGTSYTVSDWHTQKEIPSRLISCWNVSPLESRKMWMEYTCTSESVAVRSTVGRLKSCFDEREDQLPVWIGRVRYGEKEKALPKSFHRWGVNYWLYPFFGKSDDFRWENEVRATVNIAGKRQAQFSCTPQGCYIRADLGQLLEAFSSIRCRHRDGEHELRKT